MKVFHSNVSKIKVLGNRILFAPFGQKLGDKPPPGSKIVIPRSLRPPAAEGIIVGLGTPHRGNPKKGAALSRKMPGHTYRNASDPGGHKLRRVASYMLEELKIGDRVRIDNSFGHFKIRVGKLDCQIHSVLDVMFVYPRKEEIELESGARKAAQYAPK